MNSLGFIAAFFLQSWFQSFALLCNESGLCQGDLIHTTIASDEDGCLNQCANVDGCHWFSFDRNFDSFDRGTCLCMRNCPSLNEMFEFVSGQVECQVKIPYSKLLVVSGVDWINNRYVTKSEVIALTNSSKECQPWADHPTGTYGAAGAFVDSQVIICGGTIPGEAYSNDCQLITPTSSETIVSLNIGSSYSAATEFNGKVLFSGGGYNGVITVPLKRTELISINQVSPGPDLPYPVHDHCIINISEEDILLTGGGDNSYLKETWFYSTSKNWTRGPDMIQARDSHGCSSFWLKENQIIVVSPGLPNEGKTVEFLNLQQENPQWIQGPSLPDDYDYRGHKMVSNGDTLFYINTFRNVFLQLTCDESLEDCHWKTLAAKLQIPRYFAFVTLIPDYLGYQGCN